MSSRDQVWRKLISLYDAADDDDNPPDGLSSRSTRAELNKKCSQLAQQVFSDAGGSIEEFAVEEKRAEARQFADNLESCTRKHSLDEEDGSDAGGDDSNGARIHGRP